jgi:hypothetical protein
VKQDEDEDGDEVGELAVMLSQAFNILLEARRRSEVRGRRLLFGC